MMPLLSHLGNRFAAWIRAVLCEDNGNPSSMRVVLMLWHASVCAVWTGLSVYRREIVPIHDSVLALLGGLTGMKLGQKFVETKPPAA